MSWVGETTRITGFNKIYSSEFRERAVSQTGQGVEEKPCLWPLFMLRSCALNGRRYAQHTPYVPIKACYNTIHTYICVLVGRPWSCMTMSLYTPSFWVYNNIGIQYTPCNWTIKFNGAPYPVKQKRVISTSIFRYRSPRFQLKMHKSCDTGLVGSFDWRYCTTSEIEIWYFWDEKLILLEKDWGVLRDTELVHFNTWHCSTH